LLREGNAKRRRGKIGQLDSTKNPLREEKTLKVRWGEGIDNGGGSMAEGPRKKGQGWKGG